MPRANRWIIRRNWQRFINTQSATSAIIADNVSAIPFNFVLEEMYKERVMADTQIFNEWLSALMILILIELLKLLFLI